MSNRNNSGGAGCVFFLSLIFTALGIYLLVGKFVVFGIIITGISGFILLGSIITFVSETKEKSNYRKSSNELNSNHIHSMSGQEYERYAAQKLSSLGYSNIKLTKASGDFGADILASKDGFRFCIQCKRYSKPVGVKAVQEIHSAKSYYRCDKAMVVSSNRFTVAAINLAKKTDVILKEFF